MKLRTGVVIAVIMFAAAEGGKTAAPAVTHAVRSGGSAVTDVVAARPASSSERSFFAAVLTDLGASGRSQADLTSLEAWYPREYSSWPPSAANNPLDSTLQMPGAWAFNTIYLAGGGVLHVWNYPDAATGARATALTLAQGYPLIASALKSGAGLCRSTSIADELYKWSGGGYGAITC